MLFKGEIVELLTPLLPQYYGSYSVPSPKPAPVAKTPSLAFHEPLDRAFISNSIYCRPPPQRRYSLDRPLLPGRIQTEILRRKLV